MIITVCQNYMIYHMGGTLLSQVPQLTWFTREPGNLTRVEEANNYDHQDLKRERREEREKERNDIGKRGDGSSKSSRWLVRNVIVIIIVASKRNFTCGHARWKSHHCYMWPGKVILLLENKQNFNLQYRPPMVGGGDVKMTIIIKRYCNNLIDDHKHWILVTVLSRCQQLQSS